MVGRRAQHTLSSLETDIKFMQRLLSHFWHISAGLRIRLNANTVGRDRPDEILKANGRVNSKIQDYNIAYN